MAYIPSKRRRTERNPPARVALVGLPRSRGSKTRVRTGAMAEGEAKSEGGNPSRDPRARFMAWTASSPVLGAKVPAKHRASLHREVQVGQPNKGKCTQGCGMGHMTVRFGQPITPLAQPGHIFTKNRKPNRTEPSVFWFFGSVSVSCLVNFGLRFLAPTKPIHRRTDV